MNKLILVLAVAFALCAGEASAQAAADESFIYNCTFDGLSVRVGKPIELVIFHDAPRKITHISGNNGTKRCSMQRHGKQIIFIEKTSSGDMTFTSIFPNLEAVHSRHVFIEGNASSQYQGRCTYQKAE